MAFGRLRARAAPKPIGEINMTPLIDVMLVLLVIFMVAAPLMASQGLRLELPDSAATAPAGAAPEPLVVALDPDGTLYLGGEAVTAERLSALLAAAARQRPDAEVQLHADRSAPYGEVAALIGRVRQAGLHRVAFATAPAAR
ncbi:ExbD/TolR family protein [Caldimonas tepidiphila]|uniref:ExbD/TolR family protein n=1 Tax=Caldimonas tepidiphila TaxID=2315841 RepID=UPI000E5AC860|nr:biopolymer transporter ExbD [Caldimonas tepidiphila]